MSRHPLSRSAAWGKPARGPGRARTARSVDRRLLVLLPGQVVHQPSATDPDRLVNPRLCDLVVPTLLQSLPPRVHVQIVRIQKCPVDIEKHAGPGKFATQAARLARFPAVSFRFRQHSAGHLWKATR